MKNIILQRYLFFIQKNTFYAFIVYFNVIYTYILLGIPAGGGAMGGGYLHTIVTTSSPSISKKGWNLTTILLVKTLCGSLNKKQNKHKFYFI